MLTLCVAAARPQLSAALSRCYVINFRELCDVINMAAAREGENNGKEVVANLCRRNIEETKQHKMAPFPLPRKIF